MKLRAIVAAGLLAVGMTTGAYASSVGNISTADFNDGVDDIHDTNVQSGLYGANWWLVGGPADIKVDFLGREAGFNDNEFEWGGAQVFVNSQIGQDVWSKTGFFTQTFTNVASGLLDFAFNTVNGSAVNGFNPDNSIINDVNFFSVLSADAKSIVLWLDDGKDVDDNHDDMAVRLTIVRGGTFNEVPVPAAGFLLLGGLGGLAALKRRKKA